MFYLQKESQGQGVAKFDGEATVTASEYLSHYLDPALPFTQIYHD